MLAEPGLNTFLLYQYEYGMSSDQSIAYTRYSVINCCFLISSKNFNQIKLRCLLYLCLIFFLHQTISYLGSCQGSYFQATNQQRAYPLKQSTYHEPLSNWSIYLAALYMIGLSKMSNS